MFNNSNSVGYADGFSIDSKTIKIDTADANVPRIRYYGANADRAILRIDGPSTDVFTGNFGFDISYMGSRSGNANSLSIFADNGTSKIEAINILQNGNTGFGVVQTDGSISGAEHDIPPEGQGGVVTVGKLKARDIEITGDFTVTNTLTGFDFTDLGDTPTTYSGSNGRYVKVSGTELIFDSLTTSDVGGFDTTVNNLITNSNISSSQITDLTTTIQNTDLSSSQITDLTTTINNTVNDTNTTYDLSARAGDTTNQKKIRLSGSDGTNDDITIVASDGLSLTRNGSTLTLTNTDKGSSVSAGNNVSGGADNRVLTSTGGNGIKGEPNLTFDGTNLHMQKSNGAIISNGNVIAYYTSDVTLKDNVQPIANALEKVSSISGNTFTWNDKAPKSILEFVGEEDTGVIAQEVNELGLPGVVKTKDDGTMGVRYEKLVPLLIEAIKELKEEVNDLRSQIGG